MKALQRRAVEAINDAQLADRIAAVYRCVRRDAFEPMEPVKLVRVNTASKEQRR